MTDKLIHGDSQSAGAKYSDETAVKTSVQEYYGEILKKSSDLKTGACTACGLPPAGVRTALKKIPRDVVDKFYGCGNPIPQGIEGLSILDLGSGSGRDCYVAALFAGKAGKVIGIDMTESQLETARKHVPEFVAANPDAAPMEFLQGYIESIAATGVPAASVDLCISNCVVNLSPDKRAVLQGVYDSLKVGGEFYFSDVYADRRLSPELRRHEVLFGECIAGALYTRDFVQLCKEVGFADPRLMSADPVDIHDPELERTCGAARFVSATYRLFKLPKMDKTGCEQFGQKATYNGGIEGSEEAYKLDAGHTFVKGQETAVCGNTAAMVRDTWLGKHFKVTGVPSDEAHEGAYPCTPGQCSDDAVLADAFGRKQNTEGCCPGAGGCC